MSLAPLYLETHY